MHYRRTYDAKGFTPLDEINRNNVDGLRLVWAYSMRDNSRWVPTPVVANGIMYVAEGSGRVVALDVVTGDLVWSYERTYPEGITSYQRARAVTLFQDRIYWGTPDSYLVSLDARTGEVIWEVRTGDPLVGHGHTHPPLLADGKILLGNAGGDILDGVRGALRAFDPETGDLIWTFYTVPGGPGEPGWDTWPQRNQLPPLGGGWCGTRSVTTLNSGWSTLERASRTRGHPRCAVAVMSCTPIPLWRSTLVREK